MRFELIGLGIDYKRRRSAALGPVEGIVVLLVLVALGLATAWSLVPPEPLGSDAWPERFSAERAFIDIEAIAGFGPHPVGSEQHDRVREYLVQRLEDLGYDPHVQQDWIQRPGWTDGVLVRNIVARLEGDSSRPALLVTAHYDSVWAGPGAMDDAAGVAVALQIAEALRSSSIQNPVIFLLSDGEEIGLLGARAFVAYHPWAEDVEVVLNFEARGTSGLSLMFETGEGNTELVSLFADVAMRPSAASAFYELYKQLPNDTDFTVYKQVGMTGLNFANVGTPGNYHTAQDNLENVDLRTLQHLGDNALSLARRLANADLQDLRSNSDSVFFDVFSRKLIHYPMSLALPLAIAALVISIIALSRIGILQQESPAMSLIAGSVGFLASAILAFAAGIGVVGLLKLILPDLPITGYLTHHAPAVACMLAAAVTGALIGLAAVLRWSGLAGLWGGALIWWNAAVIVTTVFLPGVSYLFVFPVIACAAGLLVLSFVEPSSGWAYLVAFLPAVVVASILWMPYAGLLSLMGGTLAMFPLVPAVLLVSMAGPTLVGQRGVVRWILVAASGLVSIALVAVTYWLSA